MKRSFFSILFLLALAGIAALVQVTRRPVEHCLLDGTGIIPISRVEIREPGSTPQVFCSLCCARLWLEQHPELERSVRMEKAAILVVDEVSGLPLDAGQAYWIESDRYSRRENNCRVHVFKEKKDASRHLRRYHGVEVAGYLAGLGKTLPWAADFTAPDIQGRLHALHQYRGRIVFLRFWSAANPFVEQDLRNLEKVQERFAERGFTVVAVNVEERPEKVTRLVSRLQLTYPVLLDPDGRVADLYRITGFPTGFLLDRSGIVEESTVGELVPDLMEPLLQPLW